jgi:large exoprotein involved in heme utilization and adhesion
VLTAPKWVYLHDSEITTSVGTGDSGGGDITIDPEFVILNNSNILANAYGGPGGNIDIVADYVIISDNSRVDASSELGIDGTVNISNPDQDIAKELAVLPENYLDVTGLISDRCGTSAGSSSLVSAGPGGLAVDPDGYLPSFGAAGNVGYNGNGESSGLNSGISWLALATDPSALQFARVNCTY